MSLPQVKDYTLVEKLGSGSYSTVYKGFKKVCKKIISNVVPFISKKGSMYLRNVSNHVHSFITQKITIYTFRLMLGKGLHIFLIIAYFQISCMLLVTECVKFAL
jgi:serine/threonine protein kinase